MTVYLDQNAASLLAKAEAATFWGEIRIELQEGFTSGRVFCPMPSETILESSPCPSHVRAAIEAFFVSVSAEYRFRNFCEITVDEMLALVRSSHRVQHFQAIKRGWSARDDAALSTAQTAASQKALMANRMAAYVNPVGAEKLKVAEIVENAALERGGWLYRDLDQYAKEPNPDRTNYESGWVMDGLVKRRIDQHEALRLMEAIRDRRGMFTCVNYIDLRLASQMNYDELHGRIRRYCPNDDIDRWRAAVAMACAELFITDGDCADLCRRSKLPSMLGVTVFSVRQSKQILGFLRDRR